ERRAFEARVAKATALAKKDALISPRRMVAAFAAACLLLVGLVAALPIGSREVESVQSNAAPSPSAAGPSPDAVSVAAAPAAVTVPVTRPVESRVRERVRPRPAAQSQRPAKHPSATFAGGTRSIGWLRTDR